MTATLLDAALLQRRRSYFTGGFLSTDHITSWSQAIAFAGGSLVADVAILGVLTALAMWALTRLGLSRKATLTIAFIVALAPVVVADFIAYRLLTFLGDAFDFELMFDLAGRSPGEILAVSSGQLTGLLAAIAAGLVVLVAVIVVLRRYGAATAPVLERRSLLRSLQLPALLLVLGVLSTVALQSRSDVLDNGLRRKPTGRVLGIIVSALTDVDRDGYGLLDSPPDPAPFDARIAPWALDVPGNGIDEDGVGGDLPAGMAPYVEPAAPPPVWVTKPSIVMIGLESFRADVVGAVRGGKAVTPVLDALAARGISVPHGYSHNGYTVQSRRHMFSGSIANLRGPSTLIDDFEANGYETAYFSGQDESFGGPAGDVGFDRADVAYDARSDVSRRYSTFTTAGSLALPYDVVVERVASFLDNRKAGRPLFLYVNLHDTHFPYHHRSILPLIDAPVLTQSEIRPERADDLRAMYANTAANVDRAIGDLLTRARRSLGTEPGVIVLSDHGESLFDEGFLGHGYALNDAQTRIPLIVSNLPVVVEEPFGQVDLREIVRAALMDPAGAGRAPVVRPSASRMVFQYLGTIERPAQIAFTRPESRVLYDFRTRRVETSGAGPRRPEDLAPEERAGFLDLVRTWERMMLARSGGS